jgi:hypothetical protein
VWTNGSTNYASAFEKQWDDQEKLRCLNKEERDFFNTLY